jgi:hypothetical protein
MQKMGISLAFHETDPEIWWREASEPVRAYQRALRSAGPDEVPLPALDDPAAAPDSAAACAAAAVARLAESLVEDAPAAARLRIGGGAW